MGIQFLRAAEEGDLDTLRQMFESKSPEHPDGAMDQHGRNALMFAAKRGDLAVVNVYNF